jgi:hypothetical protein
VLAGRRYAKRESWAERHHAIRIGDVRHVVRAAGADGLGDYHARR